MLRNIKIHGNKDELKLWHNKRTSFKHPTSTICPSLHPCIKVTAVIHGGDFKDEPFRVFLFSYILASNISFFLSTNLIEFLQIDLSYPLSLTSYIIHHQKKHTLLPISFSPKERFPQA